MGIRKALDAEARQRIHELRATGLTFAAIAHVVGCSTEAARQTVNPPPKTTTMTAGQNITREQHAKILEMAACGVRFAEIGRVVGCSADAARKASRRPPKEPRMPKGTKEEPLMISGDLNLDLEKSYDEIGAELGLSAFQVLRHERIALMKLRKLLEDRGLSFDALAAAS